MMSNKQVTTGSGEKKAVAMYDSKEPAICEPALLATLAETHDSEPSGCRSRVQLYRPVVSPKPSIAWTGRPNIRTVPAEERPTKRPYDRGVYNVVHRNVPIERVSVHMKGNNIVEKLTAKPNAFRSPTKPVYIISSFGKSRVERKMMLRPRTVRVNV